jgi:hypothetical protein
VALFDEIQDRLRKQSQALAASPGPIGTQAGLTATVQAGTGRVGGAVPRASNIGEQVTQGAAAAQSAQMASRVGAAADRLASQSQSIGAAADAGAAKLQANQAAFDAGQGAQAAARATTRAAATESLNTSLAGQERRGLATQTQQFTNKAADLASEVGNAQDDLFAQFRQGTQELAFRKDAAQLEQTAQQLALKDKGYVDELERVGTLRRLDDSDNWRNEMQRLTLGDKLSSTLDSIKFKIDLNADQRTFDEQMSRMNADVASAVLLSKLQGANAQQTIQGATGLAKVGATAYNAKSSESDESQPESDAPQGEGAE